MIRPRRLNPGDRVAVVAPASGFRRDDFDAGLAELARLGFEPVYDASVFARDTYTAGPPALRAEALANALRDDSIAAIVAARGGYGSAQLLPLVDPRLVREARKPLVGYSDVTALLSFFTLTCGVVAFHGPMLDGRLSRGEAGYDRASFEAAVCRPEPMGSLSPPGLEVIRGGEHAGLLVGGTITQVLASLGTPWAFDPPAGYVLFFDEVAERPYRLDRMVLQLRQSGLLARAGAVVIGELPRCDEPSGAPTARAAMAALFADFPGPVVIGFPSGHTVSPAQTLPFGVRARLVATGGAPRLIIEEPAVQ